MIIVKSSISMVSLKLKSFVPFTTRSGNYLAAIYKDMGVPGVNEKT